MASRLSPVKRKRIIKYLSTYHGLAPEEAKPVMYLAEHRIQDETNIPNDTRARRLHQLSSLGAPAFLATLGGGLEAAGQYARRSVSAGGRSLPAGHQRGRIRAERGKRDRRFLPVDEALEFLGKTAPLHTPEWAAWRARMRAPKLAGRWLVSAQISRDAASITAKWKWSRARPTTNSQRA